MPGFRCRIESPPGPVDFSRISFGEALAGASGLALFVFMLFPWYGGEGSVRLPNGNDISIEGQNLNAWESFAIIDLLLFLAAVLAVGMLIARAADAIPEDPPVPAGLIVMVAGTLAVLLIFYRLISVPHVELATGTVEANIGRRVGLFLGLIAALGISFGGYAAMLEQSPPERRRRPV
jgi:hypothetical protein